MTVRFFPVGNREKCTLIEDFLTQHRVKHELVDPSECRTASWHRADEVPALEVDGRLFVDPNEDGLRKIFHVGSRRSK
jgi:hypothetical protein